MDHPSVPPRPAGVPSPDAVAEALLDLRVWAGRPSYSQIAVRVARLREARGESERPGRITIYDCFRAGRRRLDAQLVLDVATALAGDSDLTAHWARLLRELDASATAREAQALHPVLEIPAPAVALVGRTSERALLESQPPGSVTLVTGIGGIGKTELVLHAAASLLRRLPAGTPALFADARGFDAHRPPLEVGAVLAALLRQLDVPRERIDATLLTQRRDLLRRELAGRPAVIVVENVPDGDYLHSLLPKDGLSRVFVTSRRTLTAPDSGSAGGTGGDSGTGSAGAVPLSVQLGPLSPSDGLTLLAKRVGVDRIRQERAQSERLVELTGGIALDLTVVASAVVNHADWSLADHVYRLEGTPRDEHLRPALAMAYRALPERAQHLFRMLGLFPGSTIGPEAIGLLLGDDDSERPSEVSDLLALLEREHLIRQDPDVVLHDSVAAFARTIAAQEEPRSRQERAIVRLAEGYVELVRSAVAQGDPDWVEAERSAILAVAGLMGSWPTASQTIALAELAGELLGDRGYLAEANALFRLAIAAGGPGERGFRRSLGRVLEMQGNFPGAHEQLVLAYHPADVDAERSLNAIGNVLKRLGRLEEAMASYREAQALARSRGNLMTQGRALGNLADTLRLQGDTAQAITLFEEAFALAREAGDEVNQTIVVANTSIAAWDSGDLPEALRLARRSIELGRATGYEAGLPRYLSHLALVLQDSGLLEEARNTRDEAAAAAEASGQRDVIGELLLQQGVAQMDTSPQAAADSFERAIALSREMANPLHECEALIRLADLDVASGEAGALVRAKTRLLDAGAIAEAMGLTVELTRVATRLEALAQGLAEGH